MSTSKPQRVGEVVEAYLAWREARNKSEETLRAERQLLRKFAKEVRDIQIRNLTPDHVSNWFYGPNGLMREHGGRHFGSAPFKPLEPSTHNAYRTRLKVFFDWCTRRGLIKKDLLEDVPFMSVPKRKRIQPVPEVLLKFLDHAEFPRDRAYLALAMNTALRSSEIRRIRVGDVDLDYGFMLVTLSKRTHQDHLPITQELDQELRQWFASYAEAIGRELRDDDVLFPVLTTARFSHYETNAAGKRVLVRTPRRYLPDKAIDGQTSVRIVHAALEALGLPTRYEGTHTIRRAVARAYFDSQSTNIGYDAALRTVSALLHHTSTAVTERYLDLTSERERRDKSMRGKPFLTAMVPGEVTPLRAVGN